MHEDSPASGKRLGTQEQETLGHPSSPESPGRFQPKIDHPADCALHTAAAARYVRFAEAFVLHALGIALERMFPAIIQGNARN